ncbi:hypothetical protein ScPMuIL_014672 [Solemya velum]
MDRAARSELVKTIEAQKETLLRYETRLRDVVSAYKGIVKEKEALEASVQVLSCTQGAGGGNASHASKASDNSSDSSSVQSTRSNVDQEVSSLRDQIQTLSISMVTLTQEKSKLETSYVTEKKQLMQENEELQEQVRDLKNEISTKEKFLGDQLQEVRHKLRSHQLERQKEQTDHVIMLREIQKLLADERLEKEQLEHQLDEARSSLKEKESLVPDLSDQYKKQINDLSRELQATCDKLKYAEMKAKEPQPIVLELQNELAELKAQHRLQIQNEQKKGIDIKQKMVENSKHSEERMSDLETKLSEVSEELGSYERQRFQDQQTIQKLKDKVMQLDLENTALARASSSTEVTTERDDGAMPDDLDAHALADKIIKLKGLLKLANQKADKPISLEELLADNEPAGIDCSGCHRLQDELERVKEEFERYKLRAQSVLKSKSSKDNSSVKEVQILKDQISELRDKIRLMRLQYDEEDEQRQNREGVHHRTVLSIQQQHKDELALLKTDFQQEIAELTLELKKQRERTVSLLSEKDSEIEQLRSRTVEGDQIYRVRQQSPDSAAAASHPTEVVRYSSQEQEAISRLLGLNSGSGHGETTFLYFVEEQARKDVEINTLRKQKRDLESALRELQLSASMKEEALYDKVDNLKEEVRKSVRDKSRESANLEYLKNVTFKYLISYDAQAKKQMLNAISTILQFSPNEKTKVYSLHKGWFG